MTNETAKQTSNAATGPRVHTERRKPADPALGRPLQDAFAAAVRSANDVLSATAWHLSLNTYPHKDYVLMIETRATGARTGEELPRASLLIDRDDRLVTAYSDHPSLSRFRPPEPMPPDAYTAAIVGKVVGDLVEALTG